MSFLRRVRHKLAWEGETKRHGFFMLAEKVLIIVGITVALQLDNFNESSRNLKTEKALLLELRCWTYSWFQQHFQWLHTYFFEICIRKNLMEKFR